MGAPLNIPDEVFVAAFAAAKTDDAVAHGASMGAGVFRVLPDIVQVAIRSAAPTIVAAELDRLIEAEAVNVNESGYHWRGIDVEDLRRRASELRGEEGEGQPESLAKRISRFGSSGYVKVNNLMPSELRGEG
jgi:hypothetical protein